MSHGYQLLNERIEKAQRKWRSRNLQELQDRLYGSQNFGALAEWFEELHPFCAQTDIAAIYTFPESLQNDALTARVKGVVVYFRVT